MAQTPLGLVARTPLGLGGHTWVKLTRAAVGGSDPTGTGGSDPAHAWRVQCTACGMQMGKLKWGNLQRHHKSQTHRAAVLNTIGVNIIKLPIPHQSLTNTAPLASVVCLVQ